MTQRFLETPRGRVCYWIDRGGSGADCLVFLHGLTADHTLFEKQTEHFSKAYTVIVWDAPAHGASRPYADFSYAHAADDLHGILAAEGISSAVLIGQSMGGYVIQAFLDRYPEQARAFVGIDTCPFGTKYYTRSDLWWLRQVGWMSRCYPYGMLTRAIARQSTKTDYAYRNMLAALRRYGKSELCRLMGLGYTAFAKENRDITIPCPVLLLVGEFDRTGKVRQYCEAWHASEGYPLVVLPNAAHNANLDNAPQTNEAIERFLATL